MPDLASSWSAATCQRLTSEPTTWKVPFMPAPGKAVVALIRPFAGTAPSLVFGLSKTMRPFDTPLLPCAKPSLIWDMPPQIDVSPSESRPNQDIFAVYRIGHPTHSSAGDSCH